MPATLRQGWRDEVTSAPRAAKAHPGRRAQTRREARRSSRPGPLRRRSSALPLIASLEQHSDPEERAEARVQPKIGYRLPAMRLFRFGPTGAERPGVRLEDGAFDVSGFGRDYDQDFFGEEGPRRLA